MSRSNPVVLIFLKEVREMLRDKRVRVSAFIMPFVVIFMMFMLFGAIASSVSKEVKQKISIVASSNVIATLLQTSGKLDVNVLPDEPAAIDAIKKGKAHLVVEFGDRLPSGQIPVKLLYDPKEERSEIAKAAVTTALDKYSDQYEGRELAAHGLSRDQVRPVRVQDAPVKVGEGPGAGSLIVGILPYLLMMFTFTGGMNFAGDIVAGEKEKSTLETLLISPVPRLQIILGKLLALMAICLASGLSSIVALVVAASLKTPGSSLMFSGGLGLTPKTVLILLLLMLPLVGFFAAILVAVSSYAKNIREAQTYLSVVLLAVLMPAMFSQVIGLTEFANSPWINAVPVLNTAANIRLALQGKPSWLGTAETVAEGLILAALMLRLAIHLFNREQVLDRT